MSVLDSSLVPDADANRLAGHDKILIVDLGSQVTQLIARRVREEKLCRSRKRTKPSGRCGRKA